MPVNFFYVLNNILKILIPIFIATAVIMSKTARYIFIILGVIVLGYILWYFKNIVAYLLISLVLSLIGKPVIDLLRKVHIGRLTLPQWLCALITLALLWVGFFTFFRIFLPLIAREANDLSTIDIDSIIQSVKDPLTRIQALFNKFSISASGNVSIIDYVSEKLMSVLNFSLVSNVFSSLANLLGNIFIALFSISFITFFFLKDDKLFEEGILLFIPDKHVHAFMHAMGSTRRLLMRYFIGIIGEVMGIIILVTIGLTIVGVGFRHSLVIGLLAGVLNIIPYVGPLVGSLLGTLLGMATHLDLNFYRELLPLAGLMLLVFITVQIIDNVVFQPFIYSSSVNAHPLEIFLVIMIAGSLAGVTGMIMAIPSYTVIRVFAKEFFNQFKLVKRITQKIG